MPRFFSRSQSPVPLSSGELQILAVSALDELVTALVKASRLELSPAFLDWVADEATPFVEQLAARAFGNPRFMRSLSVGDPKIAISLWVRHWVCPQIGSRFESLAGHAAEFAESGLTPLAAEGPNQTRRTGWLARLDSARASHAPA